MAAQLVLIVEDNEKNMKLVRDVLNFHGYQTVEATTAEAGLELARTSQPALILMDIQLPGLDGVSALRHLRSDNATSHIPVIAVTASAMSNERRKILEAGFDGYQQKPIKVKEFVAEVRSVLNAGSRSDSRNAQEG